MQSIKWGIYQVCDEIGVLPNFFYWQAANGQILIPKPQICVYNRFSSKISQWKIWNFKTQNWSKMTTLITFCFIIKNF